MRKIAFFLTLILLVSMTGMASAAKQTPDANQVKILSTPFRMPSGLFYDLDGQRIVVADSEQHSIYAIDLKTHKIERIAGLPNKLDPYGNPEGAHTDGDLNTARFHSPRGVAVTESGAILVADTFNHCIRQIHKGKVTTIAGGKEGNRDGSRKEAAFRYPTAVAVDSFGYIYVADAGNDAVRRIHHDGKVTTLNLKVKEPQGLLARGEYLYISNTGNHGILVYNTKTEGWHALVPSGGGGFVNGSTDRAKFKAPLGVGFAGDDLLVADSLNHSIRRILKGGNVGAKTKMVQTLVGGKVGYDFTKTGGALMDTPSAVVVARDNIYVADSLNGRILVYNKYSKMKPAFHIEKRENISIYVDGVDLDIRDVPIVIENQTTYVPVRVVGEFIGAEVIWVQADQSVTARWGGKEIDLKSKDGTIRFFQNRAYIPLRKFAESFGIQVDWLQEYRAILLQTF